MRCSIRRNASKGNRELPFEGTALLPKTEIVPGAAMVRLKDLFNVNIAWDSDPIRSPTAGIH